MFDDGPLSDGQLKALVLIVAVVASAVAAPLVMMPDTRTPVDNGNATATATPIKGEVSTPSNSGYRSVPESRVRSTATDTEQDVRAPPSVQASTGAQTMSVETTVVDGEPALVLEDDRTHDGRWVSVPSKWLKEVHGEVPSTVSIEHESGDTYAAEVHVEGDDAAFYVKEFSTNTVTFSGSVEIDATAADGSQLQYDLSDADSTSAPSINLTGVTNTEDESYLWDSGGVKSVTVGGNIDPQNATLNVSDPILEGATDTGSDFSTQAAGDFDGDGMDEIAFEDTSGNLKTYDPVEDATSDTGLDGYSVVAAGDFDGDGEHEIAFRDTSDNLKTYDPGDGTTSDTGNQVNGPAAAGDFDGDGEHEIAFRDTSDNLKTYDPSDGTTSDTGDSAAGVPPSTGDFDGDGDDEIAFGDVDNHLSTYDPSDDTTLDTGKYSGEIVVGDFDGDDQGEIAFSDSDDNVKTYDPSDDTTSDTGENSYRVATAGDYDDDGKDEIAYRSSVDFKIYDQTDGTVTDTGVDVYGPAAATGDFYDGGGSEVSVKDQGGNLQIYRSIPQSAAVDVDTDGDGEFESSFTVGAGESKSSGLSGLSTSTTEINVTSNVTLSTVGLSFTERSATENPGVELNGETVSYNGTLADGETTQLTLNESTVQQGTNRLNVSVGDGSLSADAPDPLVELNYSHDASDKQSVDYSGGQWRESYNVSKSYASNRTNATLTIPFASEVISLSRVEYRMNDGQWQSAPYSLDGTSATIELGNMTEGDTVEVRATGRTVDPINGSITVTHPTAPDQPLNSTVQIDSAGENFRIETVDDRFHYVDGDAANTSYAPNDWMVYDQQNTGQRLHLDNATAGTTAQVKTLPVNASVSSNAVRIEPLNENASAPKFAVEPAGQSGDTVEFSYSETTSGETYILYSTSNGVQRDSATASSPVTLVDDDSAETLQIMLEAAGATGEGGSSGGGGGPMVIEAGPFSQIDADLTAPLLIIASAAAFGILLWLSRRFDLIDTGDRGDTVVETARGTANTLLANEAVVGGMLLVGAVAVWQFGVIPPETATVLVLAMIPAGVYLGLRQLGETDIRVVAGSSAVALVLGAEVLAPGTLGSTLQRLVGGVVSGLDPVFPLLAIGALALGWRVVSGYRQEASTPDEQNTVVIEADTGQSDD